MKRLFLMISLCSTLHAFTQEITARITDATTNQPLAYASVMFEIKNIFVYTNTQGEFFFNKDSVGANDKVHIAYLGYADTTLTISDILHTQTIALHASSNQLSNVTVANCSRVKKTTVNNFHGRPSSYIGPGPETKIIIISHYKNNKNITGYISNVEFYTDIDSHNPVRLHWYEWDAANGKPGRELTPLNIIYKNLNRGWNDVSLPARTIYYDDDGVVLGIEFIYSADSRKKYSSIKNDSAKLAWLNNHANRWSLGMIDKADEPSFYEVNNDTMLPYKKDNDKGYNQPSLRIKVNVCKK